MTLPRPAREWTRAALLWSLVRLAVLALGLAILLKLALLLGLVSWA